MDSSYVYLSWMAQVNRYVLVLNLDEEVEFIWRVPAKRSLLLYVLLTYGGALNLIYQRNELINILHPRKDLACVRIKPQSISQHAISNKHIYQLPTAPSIEFEYKLSSDTNTISGKAAVVFDGVILGSLLLPSGLNGMLALRVYAMYSQSKKICAFLIVCFAIVQVINLAGSLGLIIGVNFFPLASGCLFVETSAAFVLQLIVDITNCLYEVVLLVLALHRTFKDQVANITSSWRSFNTLWSILIRDNIFYFLFATLNWALTASSWIPNIPAEASASSVDNVVYAVIAGFLTNYVFAMLGPIMMLSIRRFDAKQVRGGTSNEVEAATIEFAAVGTGSRAGMQSTAEGAEV
ncbi:hypothetical protein CONPUDRAFT_70726 [Coniophora puteana RWD-64-598 SS2]|uniref:Uncharacterized protein n=1 Tax=Coniophora puteana (strain RWD-64-598) TaxID=741705 RepID=A0A5M3MXF9_CONPW|nr:uncharacterized protein CONPUDRAFT_70726 [Coniophora puteana RWD-64-598 SS2]EIW83778.1 hypothetical protein CONPUDRAFT_70726 [Coniophora puteana RWD-64-598 SS2]